MRATAAAAWEDLQAKSCASTNNNHNFILLYTLKPSPMNNQRMVISQFADICKKQGPTDHIQIT
jgi:hypothetical protein